MAPSRVLLVAVVALLAACATCIPQDATAVEAIQGSSSRDLLRRKRTKKSKKKRRTATNIAATTNEEGVAINQQISSNIDGSENIVAGGSTDPIFNFNADIGDVFLGRRKLLAVEGAGSRDLLRRRRKTTKKTTKKKNVKRAQNAVQTLNLEGVAINQQTSSNIDGDLNSVFGGQTGEVNNFVVDTGDIIIPGRRKLLSIEGAGSRDLLRKKRNKKKNTKKAQNAAENNNNEGVLINQQTSANIKGNENLVTGGATDRIDNTNVDIGDCVGFGCVFLLDAILP